MERTIVRVKRWGNSFGIVLPRTIVDNQQISEGTEIEVLVQAKNKTRVKEIFGILKGKFKRSTKEILKEVDEDFEGR